MGFGPPTTWAETYPAAAERRVRAMLKKRILMLAWNYGLGDVGDDVDGPKQCWR